LRKKGEGMQLMVEGHLRIWGGGGGTPKERGKGRRGQWGKWGKLKSGAGMPMPAILESMPMPRGGGDEQLIKTRWR
jgi:hypothetical protein